MKIVRVELNEFELEDGSIYPIEPPLKNKMTAVEFQEHYDKAHKSLESLKDSGGNNSDTESVGQRRKDKNN